MNRYYSQFIAHCARFYFKAGITSITDLHGKDFKEPTESNKLNWECVHYAFNQLDSDIEREMVRCTYTTCQPNAFATAVKYVALKFKVGEDVVWNVTGKFEMIAAIRRGLIDEDS